MLTVQEWMTNLSKHTVFTPNGEKAVQLVRERPNTPNRKEKEMSNRIKKQFWFTPEEEAEFRRKVALTGLHSLRHTFATNLVNGIKQPDGSIKSLTPRQVADLLGHTTSEITEMYYVKRDLTKLNGITDGFEL